MLILLYTQLENVSQLNDRSVFVLQVYMTGAVFSLDGSDSLKETMQTSISSDNQVVNPLKYIISDILNVLNFTLIRLRVTSWFPDWGAGEGWWEGPACGYHCFKGVRSGPGCRSEVRSGPWKSAAQQRGQRDTDCSQTA